MKLKYSYQLLVATSACFFCHVGAAAETPEKIFEMVSPSIVVVDIFNSRDEFIGQGSGVVTGVGQSLQIAMSPKEEKLEKFGNLGKFLPPLCNTQIQVVTCVS